jgi:pimeloyl-ACP methyl ester carboxylesterase
MKPTDQLPLTELPGFAHRWVGGDGVRLHAMDSGGVDRPTVVLLAGFPQTWWAWRKVMPTLADRARVIAIDLPGQGHSERPSSGYDTHTVAQQVRAAIQNLGVSDYGLVAHDIGAWVAFSLALAHPDDLRRLALLDAGIPGITLPEFIPATGENVWKTAHFAFHRVPDLPETLIRDREREYVEWFLRTKSHAAGTFDDAEIDLYAASLAADGGLQASLAYYREADESARRNHAALEQRHLSLPVLGISASHGSIPDMAASLRPWADDVTGVVVQDAGHFIPDEQPEAVAGAVRDFLSLA